MIWRLRSCHRQAVTACCPLLSPPRLPLPAVLSCHPPGCHGLLSPPVTPRLSPATDPSHHPQAVPNSCPLLSPTRLSPPAVSPVTPQACYYQLSPPVTPRLSPPAVPSCPKAAWGKCWGSAGWHLAARTAGTAQGGDTSGCRSVVLVVLLHGINDGSFCNWLLFTLSDGASSGRTSAKRKKGRSPVVTGEVHTVIFCNVS